MTIAEKRSELFKKYVLTLHCNYEDAYYMSLSQGIPDGEPLGTVFDDISYGEYDEDIDSMIDLYTWILNEYSKYGFFVNGKVVPEDVALKETGLYFPDRIYKKRI